MSAVCLPSIRECSFCTPGPEVRHSPKKKSGETAMSEGCAV